MGPLTMLLVLLLPAYLLIAALVNYRKLRQFRGPPAAGFSRAWLFWHSCHARLNRVQYDAIQQFGRCATSSSFPVGPIAECKAAVARLTQM
jgi:hypothetical protein